jgi:CHAD domain-containing protein
MAHATTQVPDVLRDAIARQRRILMTAWTEAASGDVQGIHRARVASRRLRETLALAAGARPAGPADRARRAVRRVTRALGPVREIDVALAEIDPMARRYGWSDDLLASMRRALERARADRWREMRRQLSGVGRGTIRTRSDRAGASLLGRTGGPVDARAVVQHLRRRADRVVADAEGCGTLYSVDRLHALRIAVKKLRYTLEVAGGLGLSSAAASLRLLKGNQERLGRLHDVQVLMEAIQSTVADGTADRFLTSAAILDDLERECRERHAEIVRHLSALERGVRTVRRDALLTFGTTRRAMIKAGTDSRAGRASTRARRTISRSA